MKRIVYQGNINSDFEGVDDMIFKMSDGTYWIQTRYK